MEKQLKTWVFRSWDEEGRQRSYLYIRDDPMLVAIETQAALENGASKIEVIVVEGSVVSASTESSGQTP